MQTGDGQTVSQEKPYGASIIVYRRSEQGIEYLILHRAFRGAGFEGDWAWTPPSGARLPGEAIDNCAARELLEETGLRLAVHSTSFGSPEWTAYLAETSQQEAVRLDAEHDRYAWVSLVEAQQRCQPEQVQIPITSAAKIIDRSTLTPITHSKFINKHAWMARWKSAARQLKVQVYTLYLAYKDPRTPWYARILAAGVVAYAFSPIDLIPDPIPVLGYLDDLILVPLGIILAIKLIPQEILTECRQRAEIEHSQAKPANFVAAGVIIVIWLIIASLVVIWLVRIFG